MSDEFVTAFEKLWIAFRPRWCDSHNLDGALAFSHEIMKIPLFHRIVQVNVDDSLHLFREKGFDCAFTPS